MFGTLSRSSRRRCHGSSLQETHRRVERRAAPHLEREQLRRAPRHRARNRRHVEGPHARRHQRLMRVAERRVGDEQPLLLAASTRQISSAPVSSKSCRVPGCGAAFRSQSGSGAAVSGDARLVALRVRIAVDDHVAEKAEQLRRAVAPRLEFEELRRRVDHRRRRPPAAEAREVNDVFQERNVRLHPADAELAQRAIHAIQRHLEGLRRSP